MADPCNCGDSNIGHEIKFMYTEHASLEREGDVTPLRDTEGCQL